MNVRRAVLLALGLVALAVVLPAFAQPSDRIWRVGYLSAVDKSNPGGALFVQGLRELGYVEGRNLVIDWRYAGPKPDALRAMADELVASKVDVILAAGTLAVATAQKATTTVPIVMAGVGDPVASGFVASLPRPGGNITGTSLSVTDVSAKMLEILMRTVPKLTRVGVMLHADNESHSGVLKNLQAAARRIKLALVPVYARTAGEVDIGFAKMAREKVGAVFIAGASWGSILQRPITRLATERRLPVIYVDRASVVSGDALMSYGQDIREHFRRAPAIVDKIFKGAKPGELPVEQPTRFELVINRKVAKQLGLAIPQSLLLQADEVIE